MDAQLYILLGAFLLLPVVGLIFAEKERREDRRQREADEREQAQVS